MFSNTVRTSLRSLPRGAPRSTSRGARFSSSSSSSSTGGGAGPSRPRRAYLALALGGGAILLPATLSGASSDTLDTLDTLETSTRMSDSLTSATTPSLIRSYLVYTACSLPFLIDYAPALLHALTHSPVPGVGALAEWAVRHTFFAQFVPGESVRECLPTMRALRERNVGTLLNYSAEADESGDSGGKEKEAEMRAMEKQRLQEVYRAIEAMGEFEREADRRGASAFALKITGLIDPEILERASTTLLRLRQQTYSNAPSSPRAINVKYPGTPQLADQQVVARSASEAHGREGFLLQLKGEVLEMGVLEGDSGLKKGDLEELGLLWGKLRDLAGFARAKGVKLLIDAEHTWYQPALDAYTLLLSNEFNRQDALIFGTHQCYLNRQPEFLDAAIKHAEAHGYHLGVKLVRGAYFVQERRKWADEGRPGPDPIWIDKPATDKAYNDSVQLVISTLARQLEQTQAQAGSTSGTSGTPDTSNISGPSPTRPLSVFFGTHNQDSCDLVVESLRRSGLARDRRLRPDVEGRVFIAQLYGMKDDLTDRMAAAFEATGLPFASKYIAYGKLSEVMPFLGRRAIENKSVMSGEGGAAAERKRLSRELWRRVFG